MLTNDQLAKMDRENFFHPSTHLGQFARGDLPSRVITTAEGCHITDRDGNRYLDGFAGLYCVNVGYGRREIAEAISAQARQLAYYHAYVGHGTEVSIKLAEMVVSRAPAHMGKVYFGLGGSDANETNVKLVWNYNNILGRPDKKKIISRMRGYHGSGLMTGSLTGLKAFHARFDLPLDRVLHTHAACYLRRPDPDMTPSDFVQWCAAELDHMIEEEGPDTVAAFIGEPVMGTGGLIPPPAGYWDAIQAVLRKHDVMLIADEVVTGFGRLGSMMGSTHYGMEPDLITIAKGLTSAYAPLSGSIVSDRMFEVLARGTDETGPIGHGWTYSAHPIGAAAGVANLELVGSLGLVENARTLGPKLTAMMKEAVGSHANVGEVRGEGMLTAVELMADPVNRAWFDPLGSVAPKVAAAMFRRGVIARAMPQSDIVGFAPPLCLTEAEARQIVEVTAASISEVLG